MLQRFRSIFVFPSHFYSQEYFKQRERGCGKMANHRRYDRTFYSTIFNRCIDNKITTEDRSLSIFADHDFRDRFAETLLDGR